MGLSEQWVGVRSDAEAVGQRFASDGLEPLGVHDGWSWARGGLGETDPDDLVVGLSGTFDAPALGGWVADSDCAYLVFAAPGGGIAATVVVNETLPFGEEVEGFPDLWNDLEARRSAFVALEGWAAEHAPRPVSAEALFLEMPGSPAASPPTDVALFGDDELWYDEDGMVGWVFAEDGVRVIYHRLGFAGLDEIVFA